VRETKYSKVNLSGLWYVFFGLLFVLSVGIFALAIWYMMTFNLEFKDLLFTIASPLKGTGTSTVNDILSACMPFIVGGLVLYILVAAMVSGRDARLRITRKILSALCAVSFVASIVTCLFAFRIPAYLDLISQQTTIYDDYYVDPDKVAITADGKPKNLLYIYMESMETTYASAQVSNLTPETNFMPNLTALAEKHLSFTDQESGLGGFRSPMGTGWTMAALLATTSGIPFSFPEGHNNMSNHTSFASGLTTLGDILEDKGYVNYFQCGSDATFGGRRLYFEQHGNYQISDLYTARQEGHIPKDYFVWWGYEDLHLYDIAKQNLLKLAEGDQPFNYTMLTVDAHHVGGYICPQCPSDKGNRLANVISCTDHQIQEFIDWCMDQEFMKDTVIVITGDHRRMDKILVEGKSDIERTIYNCIIGTDTKATRTTSRIFTSFDIFPTTLAAMGFKIEGDKLGLGVNLFSDLDTLAEEIGYETLDTEIQKFSDYYIREFS